MGNFLSSLFGSSQTSTYQPPEVLKNAVTDLLTRAGTQSQQPYPQYTPQKAAEYSNYVPGMVAPMTPNQAAAGQSIAGLQGYTAPNFAAATGLAGAASSPIQLQQFGPQAINQYMSPYLSNVLGAAVANINQTNAQQQQQVLGNAIQRGAFGGDRAGIAQAELARQQNLANNATIANLLNQGYGQAMQQFNTQQAIDAAAQLQNRQLMSNAALNLANLGTQGQQAALQQAQAQYGYGTAEQQQQQAGLSTAYQQFLNQYAYPYQQLGWYSQLASGTAPALGGQTTQYSPTTSPMGVGLGGLMGLGALTNPSMQSTNPFAYANAGMSALGSGVGSLFGMFMKDGGRVGYAEGGAPVADPSDAYNDYVALLAGRAPLADIQAAYLKYLNSFKGGAKPWETTPAPTATTPAAAAPATAAPAVAATGGGGGGDRNVPTTVQNAVYSPDYTSSNGPVGGIGGYGPYYAGGGPGAAFNQGGLGGVISGIVGALTGAKPYQVNPEEGYTGTVSEMGPDPYANVGTEAAAKGAGGFNVPGLDMQRLADINAAYGLPEGYLQSQAQIESRMNPDAKNPYSSAAGLFQIMKSNYEKAGIDPYDPYASAEWAAENAKTNAGLLAAAGIPVTGTNLALAHNFGIEGAKSLLADPNATMLDAFKGIFSNPVQVIASNKYNISDPAATAIGRIQSRYNAALEGFNKQAPTSMPGFLQQGRGSNITDARPYGSIGSEGVMGSFGPRGTNFSGYVAPQVSDMSAARQAERYDIGNIGQQISPQNVVRAFESQQDRGGDRGGGLDRSGPSMAESGSGNRSAESGGNQGSLGGRGSFAKSSDGGGAFSSSYSAREKRGGRVDKARGGGFEPITMQYGLPTEDLLQQAAQSFAGSGAGTLPVTATALAAKGVLPSKRGGRIHAADGAGIPAQDGDFPGMSADVLPPPKSMADIFIPKLNSTAKSPFQIRSEALQQAGSEAAIPQRGDIMYSKPIGPLQVKTTEAFPARPEYVGKNVMKAPAQIDANQFFEGEQPAPVREPAPAAPAAAPAARTEAQVPSRYMSKPPADMMNLAALQFAAQLMSPGAFGTNLANAASNYARTIMAQQNQQREQMEAEQRTKMSQAQELQQRKIQTPTGLGEVYEGPNGQLLLREVPLPGELPSLPGMPGGAAIQAAPTQISEQDMNLGPIHLGDEIPASTANKTRTLAEMGAPYKKQGYGSNAAEMNKQYSELALTANQDAQAAQNTFTDINQAIRQTTNLDDKGFLASGADYEFRSNIANRLNTLWDMSGFADKYGRLDATAKNLASTQILEKLATIRAQESQRGLGREAGFWLNALKTANPSAALQKEAANELLANMIVSNRRANDRAAVYNAYGQASGRMGVNAPQAFEALNPGRLYDRDISVITDILNNTIIAKDGTKQNAITALKEGRITRAEFDKKVKEIYKVANLSRYF